MKGLTWILLAIACMSIGVYPLLYVLLDGKFGLLQLKADETLNALVWRISFYTHILTGGVALFIGWGQFVQAFRDRFSSWHRSVGMLYVVMVTLSGLASIYLSLFTSTGWIAGLGFGSLAVIWLSVTLRALQTARSKDFVNHEYLMVYSYSACCAAVTLRLWLPFLMGVLRFDFSVAYPIVAWLCWVPNLFVAWWIVSRKKYHRNVRIGNANSVML